MTVTSQRASMYYPPATGTYPVTPPPVWPANAHIQPTPARTWRIGFGQAMLRVAAVVMVLVMLVGAVLMAGGLGGSDIKYLVAGVLTLSVGGLGFIQAYKYCK